VNVILPQTPFWEKTARSLRPSLEAAASEADRMRNTAAKMHAKRRQRRRSGEADDVIVITLVSGLDAEPEKKDK
jgi:hypothetical protein